MCAVWRSLFIWLLVLAVPVQGIAAVGMQHCAPTHERMAPPVAAAHAPHAQAPAKGHAHSQAHAPVDVVLAVVDETPVPETAPAVNAEHAASALDFKCSACAACCPALGLPAVAQAWTGSPGAPGLAQLRLPLLASFVPGGLDRPPRSQLA